MSAPLGAAVVAVDARLLVAMSIVALACASALLARRLRAVHTHRAGVLRPLIGVARRRGA